MASSLVCCFVCRHIKEFKFKKYFRDKLLHFLDTMNGINVIVLVGLMSVVYSQTVRPCVEECSIVQRPGCPKGFECKSNGCGHSCQPKGSTPPKGRIGTCAESCFVTRSVGCRRGYQCVPNGCGHSCRPINSTDK
ncbi:hypothetical protein Btru_058271 [Bulinus truncatus]|nr:hypothetical protein Btru_058271 [Bulinus truncatus]